MIRTFLNGFFSEINTIPAILRNQHYPSLDGLRGVAILLVIFAHLQLSTNFLYSAIFSGPLGVLIFFVLSGFLITTLCIREKVTTGTISLKNFYVRRVLRILPVAYLYLVVICVLNQVFNLKIHYISLLGSMLFLQDFTSYFRKYYSSWYTGHYWSLSVEEQFYLLVPFILKKQFKLYLFLILFIIFAIPAIMVLQYFYPVFNSGALYAFTHFLIKFQAIAVGCFCSICMFKYADVKSVFAKYKLMGNVAAILIIFSIGYNDLLDLQNVFSGLIVSLLTGYIIITNITTLSDFVYKFLNWKALKIIGILSYSIYIWQELFTARENMLPGLVNVFPYNVLWIAIVSSLSYYIYESYFLRLKKKFYSVKKVTSKAEVSTTATT